MKVSVKAGGREVEIDCPDTNTSPKEIRDLAVEAWKATEGTREPSEGPAYGFQSDRRSYQVSPMNMGGYGRGHIDDPRAGEPS